MHLKACCTSSSIAEVPCRYSDSNTQGISSSLLQGDQKVSVHLMNTIQKVTSNVQSVFDCLSADRQGQGDTRLTLTPSIIPNYNYVIIVSDWNGLKYFCVFLYCNHQVHRDFLITLYMQVLFRYACDIRTWCVADLWTHIDSSISLHITCDDTSITHVRVWKKLLSSYVRTR
jgi:hypothetical protein